MTETLTALIDGEYVPITITTGPEFGMVWMHCGRVFSSRLLHPTDRKRRYHRQVVARHERRCTRCKHGAKVARQWMRENHGKVFKVYGEPSGAQA